MNERLELVPMKKQGTMPSFKGDGGVIRSKAVSKEDEETIIRLYKALVGKEFNQKIDIPLLWEEGIPCFKEMLGEKDWQLVWKYFKDGYKQKNAKKQKKVDELVSKLTTIDNACHYIMDFKKCINRYAKLIIDAPEGMPDIIKAKFLRAFEVLFGEYNFFVEDFVLIVDIQNELKKVPLERNVLENNRKIYRPEQMFMLYDLKLFEMTNGGFIYPLMMEVVNGLDKAARKEFFRFAELEVNEGKLCDKNEVVQQTFGDIRKIKMRINDPQGYAPIESYVFESFEFNMNAVVTYSAYRLLSITDDWTSFPVVEEMVDDLECSHIVHRAQRFYEPCKNNLFASIKEMNLFKKYFEYLIDHEYEFIGYLQYLDTELRKEVKFNLKLFMAAQQYFQEYGYYNSKDVDLEMELFLASVMFEEFDCEAALRRYASGEISCEEFREELGIDFEVDKDKFKVVEIETAEDAFVRFMEEQGFELNEENYDRATKVIFEGNEDVFNKYSEEEINAKQVKNAIFFKEEVVEQICNLDKVDFDKIEEYLLSIKSSRVKNAQIKKDSLIIKFYCYLVKNSVACGTKKKKAKANRRLKVSILENLIS